MVAAPALAAASVLASTLAFAQAGGSPEWEAQYGRSSGCGEAPPYNPSNPNDSLYVNVEIDGLERGYLLHRPPRPGAVKRPWHFA